MGMALTFEAKGLLASLAQITPKMTAQAIAPGIFQAGNALLKDAIYIGPQAPFKEGTLRGSAMTMGANSTLYPYEDNGTKGDPVVTAADVSIDAGFNIVYAAKWHEYPENKPVNWTRTGALKPGRKFLTIKLGMFGLRYEQILGKFIKRWLEGGV